MREPYLIDKDSIPPATRKLIRKTIDTFAGTIPPFSKKWLFESLNLPAPEDNDVYTGIFFAHEVEPGGVAILSINTSDPTTVTSHARQAELAEQAMGRGAKLLISTYQIKDLPCLVVDDVMAAYCAVVCRIREQFHPRTIGITGSIGKTTTTQMVYSVISYKYRTHRNGSSANNLRLAARVIHGLKPEHQFYVQEIMEGPPYRGAAPISKLVQPQAAVVTMVGSSHMETFGSQERILESCLSIQDGMPKDGLLILNGDDPLQWGAECELRKVYYAIENEKADYRAVNIHSDGIHLLFDVEHDGIKTPVRLRCFGMHNVLNATAAFAAGKWAGMTDSEIAAGLDRFRTEGIRQNFVRYGGKNLFLDCYNAAPESIKSAVDSLMMIPVKKGGRRIAVLADIKESGEKEHDFHRQVGEMVAKSRIDYLVCYGKLARIIAGAVLSESNLPVFHTENQSELVDFLKNEVKEEDVVLFKGSHSMALEQAVDLAFGTWFHETYDRFEFRSKVVSDADLRYRIFPDHATVIEKLSGNEKLIVPNTVENVPVTGIGVDSFNQSRSLKEITLPEKLENIRYRSFFGVSGLKEVIIPAGTKIIGEGAFANCRNLQRVVINHGCTHIDFQAFANCPNLTDVIVPPSVRQINNEVFLNCKKLTVYGAIGSYAEQYALSRGIPFAVAPPADFSQEDTDISPVEMRDEDAFLMLLSTRKDDIVRFVKDNEKVERDQRLREYYLSSFKKKIKPTINELNAEQLAQIKDLWGKYYTSGLYNPEWNAMYASITGSFDPRFIPQDLHYLFVERTRMDRNYQIAFSDKNYLNLLFPTIKQPHTFVRRINGWFYDSDFLPLTRDEAYKTVRDHLMNGLVAKKSRESSGGKGVVFLSLDTDEKVIQDVLNSTYDIQIQECIRQHPAMGLLNPTSVNTIRFMTIIIDGKAELLSSILRIGGAGSRLDNLSSGGFGCGIDENGRLKNYAYQVDGTKHFIHPSGHHFEEVVIPRYKELVETIKRLHYYIPILGVVSWDICIDESGDPVLIEINVGEGGIGFHQYNNGPLYGDLREKILDQTFKGFFDRSAVLDYSYRIYLDRIVIEKGSKAAHRIVIPEEIGNLPVTRIGSNAFMGSTELHELFLPKTVTSIGRCAFFSCKNLKSVTLREGLKEIEQSAFNECMSLEEIELPSTVTTIGRRAFWDCHALTSVFIPKKTKIIGEDAFGHSSKVVIQCEKGSFAEQYAKENGIPFAYRQ